MHLSDLIATHGKITATVSVQNQPRSLSWQKKNPGKDASMGSHILTMVMDFNPGQPEVVVYDSDKTRVKLLKNMILAKVIKRDVVMVAILFGRSLRGVFFIFSRS